MMTTAQFIAFIIVLTAPFVYQRSKFVLSRSSFDRPVLREKCGLQIHHGHWGVVMAVASSFLMVFGFHNGFTVIMAGLGWGLILDEVIPMLRTPSVGRQIELRVYAHSTRATAVLISCLAIISFVLYITLYR